MNMRTAIRWDIELWSQSTYFIKQRFLLYVCHEGTDFVGYMIILYDN